MGKSFWLAVIPWLWRQICWHVSSRMYKSSLLGSTHLPKKSVLFWIHLWSAKLKKKVKNWVNFGIKVVFLWFQQLILFEMQRDYKLLSFRASFVTTLRFSNLTQMQCRKFRIFLSLIFYVKSVFEHLEGLKLPFFQFQVLWILFIWSFSAFKKCKS